MTSIAINTMTRGSASVRSFFGRMVDSIREANEQRRAYDAVMSELQRLDDKEMHGLGISRADFHDIASGNFKRSVR
ncbi:hypothetical protein [Fodinicurvata sp. EGI_FJ10296]|uniref:hypothetical protein n=1 Tax=Fodinicurvata sp. EGI_FJ10296 TaxID=3231908 RepID=UPI003451FF09